MSREKGRAGLVLFLGLGLALLLALAALGASFFGGSEEETGSSSLPPMGSAASDKSLGVNADLGSYDGDASAQALSEMESAGLRWLRLRFPWDEIEVEKGVYDWAVWDEIIGEASKHDLQILAVLDGSPAWVREDADLENALAPPAEIRAFGEFVSVFAHRYGDQIDHYQVWDEPNIAPHWGAREIDPAAYARLLREGAIRIRSADPEAVVLAAALAPTVEPGGANMNELVFLEELYQHGAAEWFDGVAVQLYDFGETPDEPPDPARLNWQRATLLREVMERQGDSKTPVWAVSAGLGDAKASEVSAAIEAVRDDWPWLGPIVWAAWMPWDARGVHALMDDGGQSQPAFDSLRGLATASPVAWPGAYQADHESGRYEGNWRVTDSGADIGGSGDRLYIPFRGTRLDLVVRRGEYRAFLYVTVDGQPANALPQDMDGRAYVVLYDPLSEIDSVTLARDLTPGEHVVEIVADRGWGQWAIGGWTVWNGAAAGLPWRTFSILLGLAALATFVVVLWQAWPQRRVVAENAAQLSERCVTVDERLVLAITAAAAILVYLSPGTVPSLLSLGLLFALLLLRPATGLPLIAVALPFYQVGKPLLGKVFSMVEILTVLTAVAWFASWTFGLVLGRNGRVPGRATERGTLAGLRTAAAVPKPSALDWGMLALVLVGLASLLWAEHGRVAAREFRTVVLGSALFYGLLRAMVRGRQTAWRVTDAWVLGGTLVALVGVVQWVLGENLIAADGVSRVRAFYGSPNNLALYLGRLLPLVLAITVWSKRQPRKWFYGIAAIAMAAALLLTFSRGAWLVGVPISILFVAGLRGWRSLVLAAGLLAAVAIMGLLLMGSSRLALLLDPTTDTTYFRLQLWRSSLAMIRDHPVLGVGLDNFLYQYRTHYVLPTAWEEFNLSHPHNLVLDSWLRLGLPGLAAFAWLLVSFFRCGWLAYRHLRESGERLLALGLLGGMVCTVAHGLIDNAFFLVDLAYVFTLMLALIQWTQSIVEKAPNGSALADSASPVN